MKEPVTRRRRLDNTAEGIISATLAEEDAVSQKIQALLNHPGWQAFLEECGDEIVARRESMERAFAKDEPYSRYQAGFTAGIRFATRDIPARMLQTVTEAERAKLFRSDEQEADDDDRF